MIRWIVILAGSLGFIGVMIGSYAAHGLEEMLTEQGLDAEVVAKRVDQCKVGVLYHMLHTLVLLVLRSSGKAACPKKRQVAAIF